MVPELTKKGGKKERNWNKMIIDDINEIIFFIAKAN